MKRKYFCLTTRLLLFSVICAVSVNAQNTGAYLSEILKTVQKNTDRLKELNANLLADEEITIEEFDDKGKKKTTNVVSEYRVIRTKSDKPFSYDIPQEDRKVLSVKENGKNKKTKKFDEPFFLNFANSFTDLFVAFDKQNEKDFYYTLRWFSLSDLRDKNSTFLRNRYSSFKFDGIEKFKGRNVYILDILQKETDTGKTISNWKWSAKYFSVALIDIETMEIVQLHRQRIVIVEGDIVIKECFTQIEYDKVKVGDQILTLPVAKTVEVYRKKDGKLEAVYKYKYSNYKAFTIDVKIKYGTID